MAKLMNSKDGGMKAMQLANTLLSVMSAASDNELKTEDKIKVTLHMRIGACHLTELTSQTG